MQNFNELNYFLTVAQVQSFVQAGQLLGVSSSALSHSMKNLETRLGLRLFNRTTRNISLTEAGQQLYQQIAPHYQAINAEIAALNDFLNTSSGTIRINTFSVAAEEVLYPKLRDFMRQYPQINLEIMVENRWVDIVKAGFDFGVRLGRDVANDMIAVPISAPLKMALVASPDYIAENGTPKSIEELAQHRLIGMRISAQHGSELMWEFKVKKETVKFLPHPQFSINNHLRTQAVLDGLGIAWMPHTSEINNYLTAGKLIELLPKNAMHYDPFYLYYPSRHGHSRAFKLVLEALRLKTEK
ncbi:LysR family transcriptional regulator [Rodentibacter myodis]|uniref:LysR family transcriptional regulator n=1 Tax=Rodentibacter myodis TaxID=1907939 RepID=A0A1V3JG66_9PAST|nr:LysR family transcriptional regulator [Rodentibacter myodis]OOF55614.1 LysR family transcriptional regulator [Rodentibacter myodis]